MNKELALKKALIFNNDNKIYKTLEEIYKYLFEVYIMSKINLKLYDEEIKNSGYYFGKTNLKDKQMISGLKEYLGLDYICVLNNFFIEKLEKEDIELLKKCLMQQKLEVTNELLMMVQRTYKDIIKKNYLKGEYTDKKYKVCYGVAIPSNFANNDALVLKIYYSKNTKQLNDEEFIDNIKKQKEFIEKLSKRMKKEIESVLNISCEILNEKTVK